MPKRRFARIFAGVIIGLGLCSGAFILAKASLFKLNYLFLLVSVFALCFRVRKSAGPDELRSDAVLSGTFITLAFLLFGGVTAVAIAIFDATFDSIRAGASKFHAAFRISVAVFATFTASLIVKQVIYPSIIDEIHNANYSNLFLALTIFTVIRFAISAALNLGFNKVEREYQQSSGLGWCSVVYSASAVIAGITAVLVDAMGFKVLLASVPLVLFVFQTNRMHLKNVEISKAKAAESARYAEILEEQANELRESKRRFRTAFEFAPIGIALVSDQGEWLEANPALGDLLGCGAAELIGRATADAFHPDDRSGWKAGIDAVRDGDESFDAELRLTRSDGSIAWVSVCAASVTGNDANENLIVQIQDITDRRQTSEKLRYEAQHDSLTGLPNRSQFISRLDLALTRYKSDPTNCSFGVLFVDLDRFKLINDSFGHFAGDELLRQIATRVHECLGPDDILARLAGDEFTVLVEGAEDIEKLSAVASAIERKFAEPFPIDGVEVFSSASIGIVVGSDDYENAEALLRDADIAMYQAKSSGRGKFEFFDVTRHARISDRAELERDLRQAIGRDEITLHYQPILSLVSRRIEGFEALARWQHRSKGFIPPDRFIPVAEEAGLIGALGWQILRRACRDARAFIDSGHAHADFSISVNVSCQQLSSPAMVDSFLAIVEESGLEPGRLQLEITESSFCEHPDRGIEVMNLFREHGIRIAVDDFGTGYSNLKYLSQLPISTLKIDRSFVQMIDETMQDELIVRSIFDLARGLGIETVAEGVETREQLEALSRTECDYVQGYLFSKPLPFEEAMKTLELQNMPGFDDLASAGAATSARAMN